MWFLKILRTKLKTPSSSLLITASEPQLTEPIEKPQNKNKQEKLMKMCQVLFMWVHILDVLYSFSQLIWTWWSVYWASLVAQMVKNLPAVWETWLWSLGWEDPLEEGMATHSSILAWRIPMDRGARLATVHVVTGHNWASKHSTARSAYYLHFPYKEAERL